MMDQVITHYLLLQVNFKHLPVLLPWLCTHVFCFSDKQEPEIPVSPTLHKTSKHGLNLSWEHPNSDFKEGDNVYFNYTVVVVGEDGYHQTWSLDVESHIPPKLSLDLTGQECKHLNISISLPGNCEAKQQTAALLISEYLKGSVSEIKYQRKYSSITIHNSKETNSAVHIILLPYIQILRTRWCRTCKYICWTVQQLL